MNQGLQRGTRSGKKKRGRKSTEGHFQNTLGAKKAKHNTCPNRRDPGRGDRSLKQGEKKDNTQVRNWQKKDSKKAAG